MSELVSRVRKAIWHLRTGGYAQIREWRRRNELAQRQVEASPEKHQPESVADFYPISQPIDRPKSFMGIRVGVILDDFSLQAWTPEFETVLLSPSGWQEEIAERGIDLLFVESAWAGNHGTWQFKMVGSKGPSTQLRELAAFCQSEDIPTVFWNKEDPVHFDDFIETARLFDFVFTSDSNMIPTYKEVLGHDRINSLSFAAQPSIHNPIKIPGIARDRDIAFAGMYFSHKYPERREQMDLLLGAALDVEKRKLYGFDIFSRHHGGNEKYQFPGQFENNIVGALPYDKMLSAYKNYKVFLNVNSVVNSPSMCARRVFELLASGTPVVSTHSDAMSNFFTEQQLPIVSDAEQAGFTLRALLNSHQVRDRMVHSAQREIWSKHTYAHRAMNIFKTVGIDAESPLLKQPAVSVVTTTNRPQFVRNVIDSVASQENISPELVLVTHGFEANVTELLSYAKALGLENLTILHKPSSESLGSVLNSLVAATSGDVVAKFDDDDFYAPMYLQDSINAMKFSAADVVGKMSHYMYSVAENAVHLRNPGHENKYSRFVSGATLVGKKDLFVENPFENVGRGEDTRFLQTVTEANGTVYSSDRFNFMQIRGDHGHTWDIQEVQLQANAIAETFGKNLDHVIA